MKKVFKFLGTAAAVGAAVVGGIAVYKRFFAPAEDIADLDDEFDDEFDDEDLDSEPVPAERGYVSLHSSSEQEAPKAPSSDKAEEENVSETDAPEEATRAQENAETADSAKEEASQTEE